MGCGMRDAELISDCEKSWVGMTGMENSIGDPHDQ